MANDQESKPAPAIADFQNLAIKAIECFVEITANALQRIGELERQVKELQGNGHNKIPKGMW